MKTIETDSRGNKYWFMDGLLHREDGPAVEYADGDRYWWINDQLHRDDGPAVEYAGGYKEWYLNGDKIYVKNNDEFLRLMKLRAFL